MLLLFSNSLETGGALRRYGWWTRNIRGCKMIKKIWQVVAVGSGNIDLVFRAQIAR